MRAAFLLSFILGVSAAVADEAEWKSRFEAIDAARMRMRSMEDHQRIQAQFAALARDLEAALKQERAKGEDSAETAVAAYWLASAYLFLNRYADAAPLLKTAMEIRVKRFGESSLPVAEVWDKLAWLGQTPDEIAAVMRKALAVREAVLGPEHRDVAANLRDIGMNRLTSRRYAESEAAYERAIAIMEKVGGRDGLDVIEPVSDLAWLRIIERKPEEAIPLYRRALAVAERASGGADDERVAKALENLAYAYGEAKRYRETEELYLRAIAARERLHGPKHDLTVTAVGRLRDIYIIQGRSIDSWKLGRKIEAAQ
jgi:tetratricopeptide (TPR) repeat protein